MGPVIRLVLYTGGLFFGVLIMMEIGRHLASGQRAKDPKAAGAGFGVLEGALFGLMGLVLAFSFSGAASRFDARRQLITEESNAIGTAYLRLDVLPAQAQPELREMFRQYLDTRLAAYNGASGLSNAEAGIVRSQAIQARIWAQALAASQKTDSTAAMMLLLPALNGMFDVGNSHYMAFRMHPPRVIYLLMGILILICSLLAGFEMGFGKARSWIHVAAFAALMAITVYTIIDLEYPRLGLFQVKDFDQALIDVRNSMDAR